jgi:hypothetical protein
MQIVKKKNASDNMVSLTDVYKQAKDRGLVEGKRKPGDWAREAGALYIDFLAKTMNTRKTGIYTATRGAGGGASGHPLVALEYARYLSEELAAEVNDTFLRAKTGDVTLAEEVYDLATPGDQKFLEKRIASKAGRREWTDALKVRGVTGMGYGYCTNEIYKPILGGKSEQVKKAKGIPKKANLRDNLSVAELADLIFAERLATKRMEEHNARGTDACAAECRKAAHAVVAALLEE